MTDTIDLLPLKISSVVQRQLDRLTLRGSRWIPGFQAGQRPSPRKKPAAEFMQHRKYVPGDDIRFVDWRASARSEHIYLKQGENPQEATLYLLLDLSASMGWGDPPKYFKAAQIAMMLAYTALSHGDRVVLAPFNKDLISPIGPLRGKSQVAAISQALRRLAPGEDGDLYQAIQRMQNRFATKGGMLIVLSDLLGVKNLEAVLDRLPNPRWIVTLLHLLHPEELRPEVRGDYIFEDIETGQTQNYDVTDRDIQQYQIHLQAWFREIELTCRIEKAFYLRLETNDSLEKILPRMRAEKILVPR